MTDDWMIGAPCTGNTDLFFDEMSKKKLALARKICGSCAVYNECLEYSLRHRDVGVWAGMTANQRSKLRRSLKIAVVVEEPHA